MKLELIGTAVSCEQRSPNLNSRTVQKMKQVLFGVEKCLSTPGRALYDILYEQTAQELLLLAPGAFPELALHLHNLSNPLQSVPSPKLEVPFGFGKHLSTAVCLVFKHRSDSGVLKF